MQCRKAGFVALGVSLVDVFRGAENTSPKDLSWHGFRV